MLSFFEGFFNVVVEVVFYGCVSFCMLVGEVFEMFGDECWFVFVGEFEVMVCVIDGCFFDMFE